MGMNQSSFDRQYNFITEPPEAPVNLTVVEIKSRSVLLSWSKPFDGHSKLINYIIEYQNITGRIYGLCPVKYLLHTYRHVYK